MWRLNSTQVLTESVLKEQYRYTLALDVATTLVLRLEQFNIYARLYIVSLLETDLMP